MKERWFNYRPICLVFAFLLLGSVFSFYISNNMVVCISLFLVSSFALATLSICKKKPQYILVPLISFIIGVSCYYLVVFNFNKTIDYTPKTIESRIYAISNEENGVIKVEADSCRFNGNKINDNIIIYIYDNSGLFENIEVGSVIKFKPYKFYKTDLFYYETPNSNLFSSDLKYTTSAIYKDVEYLKTDKNFSEKIKERVKNNLSLGLTNENTEIAFSALFGDKDMLAEKQYSAYKLSGVAHLLAVSGLHVGIIVAILNKVFKWLKIKKWYKFATLALILLLYTHICGYSISIVRASIMSLLLLLAGILQREYDPFTSISIAGIVIYLTNPLCIFDVGFLLSFSCVIGITMLYKPIKRALSKTKMPIKIVDAMSISIATSVSIIFIMAYYFKTLNIISIIANVILIPIFAVAFTAVFVVSIISILFPFASYILYPVNYIFGFINILAIMFGNLAISNFNTIEFNFIAIIIYFVLLLFLGRFCTAKYQYKIVSTLPMVAMLFYCLL